MLAAQEQPVCALSTFVFAMDVRLRWLLCFVFWCICWFIASRLEFGAIFFAVSALIFMFTNLGTRKPGEKSAYSVFNEGFHRLLGSTDPEQIDRQLRNQGHLPVQPQQSEKKEEEEEEDEDSLPVRRLSKLANKKCPCGSGKKFKKCCSTAGKSRREDRSGDDEDDEDGWG